MLGNGAEHGMTWPVFGVKGRFFHGFSWFFIVFLGFFWGLGASEKLLASCSPCFTASGISDIQRHGSIFHEFKLLEVFLVLERAHLLLK